MSTELATERLRPRLCQLADAEKPRDLWAERDPRSLHVIDSVGRPTVDDLRTILARQLAETALTGLALLAIEDRDHGQFIGYCGLIVGRATWEESEISFVPLTSRPWLRHRGRKSSRGRRDQIGTRAPMVNGSGLESAIAARIGKAAIRARPQDQPGH